MLFREEYIAAFTHEDRFVRNMALELVTRCKAGGMDATLQALRTIETHGFDRGFLYLHNLLELPLDDETSGQLLALLSSDHHRGFSHLAFKWLITMAPVGFLGIHRDAIRGLEKDHESFFSDDFIGKRIEGRLRLAATPPSELLRRLDELPMECSKPTPSYPDDLVNEASRIIDILAAIPAFRGELESRANSWLALDLREDAPKIAEGEAAILDNFWPALFAVSIVGKLRLQHTIPTLVKLLSLDVDSMNEYVAKALVEMNSIHALQAWEEAYPNLEWHERLYLSGTCSHISEPGVDVFLQRLLDNEHDPELFMRLMGCLSMQPTERATKLCAEFHRKYQDDPETQEIAENLYTRHIILDQDHPDLEIWKKINYDNYERFLKAKSSVSDSGFPAFDDTDEESLEEEAFDDARLPWNSPVPSSQIAEPFVAPPKAGRNDPCPCGSGKKFKKCCFTA